MKTITVNTELTKLYATQNSLPAKNRAQLCVLINQHLATAIDLQMQLKQAHWSVKGPNFISLHELFDEINGAVAAYVDLLAERVVQLGGIAQGTVAVAASRSQLEKYPLTISAGSEHVKAVAHALAYFGREVREAIDETAAMGDADTADLFTEVSRGIDKWLWFVEAHTQAAA
jgi:starvation-inducible DNA-binding protein